MAKAKERASWQGALRFGLVNLRVAAYPLEKGRELQFSLLDRRDHSPIGTVKVNKATQRKVNRDDIVKGFKGEGGEMLILTDEDFERAERSLQPHPSFQVEVFVPLEKISPIYYEKPYVLAPIDNSDEAFRVLHRALLETKKGGVGKIRMHHREHLACVLATEDSLILELLRFSDEIDIPELKDVGLSLDQESEDRKEMRAAIEVITHLTDEWKPEEFEDSYVESLKEILSEKNASRTRPKAHVRKIAEPPATSPDELLAKLEESLRRMDHRSPRLPHAG